MTETSPTSNLTRNLVVAAVVAVLMGGFVLAYLAVAPEAAEGVAGGMGMQTGGGDGMGGGMGMGDASMMSPPVVGYAEGEQIMFIHTEASDRQVAKMLTDMMGSPVLLVPELADAPDSMLANVYVFENGIQPEDARGPFGYQPDVFDAPPGTDGYSPLRSVNLVTWNDPSQARVLESAEDVLAAQASGEVAIEEPGIVVNMPFLMWAGGQR